MMDPPPPPPRKRPAPDGAAPGTSQAQGRPKRPKLRGGAPPPPQRLDTTRKEAVFTAFSEQLKGTDALDDYMLATACAVHDTSVPFERFLTLHPIHRQVESAAPVYRESQRNARLKALQDNDEGRKCPLCGDGEPKQEQDGDLLCGACGCSFNTGSRIATGLSDMQNVRRSSPSVYLRVNHFKETLAQLQAREVFSTPREVLQALEDEIVKYRVDRANLNFDKVRELLRRTKHSKYYEHVPSILFTLTKRPVPYIDDATESALLQLFHKVKDAFVELKPPGRKNFLSYSYVLYKLLQLLGLENKFSEFKALKSRDKILDADVVWKKICERNDWRFIQTALIW